MECIASTIIDKVAERGGVISPQNTPTPKIYNQPKKSLPSQSLTISTFIIFLVIFNVK